MEMSRQYQTPYYMVEELSKDRTAFKKAFEDSEIDYCGLLFIN